MTSIQRATFQSSMCKIPENMQCISSMISHFFLSQSSHITHPNPLLTLELEPHDPHILLTTPYSVFLNIRPLLYRLLWNSLYHRSAFLSKSQYQNQNDLLIETDAAFPSPITIHHNIQPTQSPLSSYRTDTLTHRVVCLTLSH